MLLSPRSALADWTAVYDAMFQNSAAISAPDGPDWRWLKAQGIQESGLNPLAHSPVGAEGIMQFMPGTWREVCRDKGWGNVARTSAYHSIVGGVYYQMKMDRIWRKDRSIADRHDLGLASYNAGPGTILKAQAACLSAKLWAGISACVATISGPAHAKETIGYVRNIAKWRGMIP